MTKSQDSEQLEKFKKPPETEVDDDAARWDEQIMKVVKAKPRPEKPE